MCLERDVVVSVCDVHALSQAISSLDLAPAVSSC